MITKEKIEQATQILVEAARPEKIILFGSYARGTACDGSDVDFLVIKAEASDRMQEMVRLRRALRPLRIPVDILVYSRDEIDEWGHLPGTVIYWALKEGKVVHEATR
jgi:predicted nucleotidyltransferase